MGTKNDTVITPDPITAELEPFAPAVMETGRRAHKCKACDENRHNLRIATRFVTSATGSARHNVGRDAAERVPLIALRRQRWAEAVASLNSIARADDPRPHDDARQHAARRREMTKHDAIEKCARATVKRQGYREDQWRQYATHVEFAENIVVALEALGLLKPSS